MSGVFNEDLLVERGPRWNGACIVIRLAGSKAHPGAKAGAGRECLAAAGLCPHIRAIAGFTILSRCPRQGRGGLRRKDRLSDRTEAIHRPQQHDRATKHVPVEYCGCHSLYDDCRMA